MRFGAYGAEPDFCVSGLVHRSFAVCLLFLVSLSLLGCLFVVSRFLCRSLVVCLGFSLVAGCLFAQGILIASRAYMHARSSAPPHLAVV